MATNTDGGWAEIVLDPIAFHGGGRGLQLERFLIKLSRAFLVRNGDGNECDFFNHKHGSFSFWFQFVNDDIVPVRVLDDRDPTTGTFKWLGCERNLLIF